MFLSTAISGLPLAPVQTSGATPSFQTDPSLLAVLEEIGCLDWEEMPVPKEGDFLGDAEELEDGEYWGMDDEPRECPRSSRLRQLFHSNPPPSTPLTHTQLSRSPSVQTPASSALLRRRCHRSARASLHHSERFKKPDPFLTRAYSLKPFDGPMLPFEADEAPPPAEDRFSAGHMQWPFVARLPRLTTSIRPPALSPFTRQLTVEPFPPLSLLDPLAFLTTFALFIFTMLRSSSSLHSYEDKDKARKAARRRSERTRLTVAAGAAAAACGRPLEEYGLGAEVEPPKPSQPSTPSLPSPPHHVRATPASGVLPHSYIKLP
ncbi:hypothetical protein JCM10213_008580 [Rhodosporidiobolus nylandii]